MNQRVYGRVREVLPVPNLRDLQVESYRRFLQLDRPVHRRAPTGLEGVLREVFPIESYDKSIVLEYMGYELSRPRYTERECRRLRLTFGMPFKVRVRMRRVGEGAIEEEVFLGEVPKMIGGGEFVINGAERLIVAQLHRSPGVDFAEEPQPADQRLYKARLIPERGSWIEMELTASAAAHKGTVITSEGGSRKATVKVRIDQSGKFPATSLLRCFGPGYETDGDILRLFHPTERVALDRKDAQQRLEHKIATHDIIHPETGEVIAEALEPIAPESLRAMRAAGVADIEVVTELDHAFVLNTLREDVTKSAEDALMRLYARLRPGYPPDLAKARDLFAERFQNPQRYSLGRVGRFRLNRKFGVPVAADPAEEDLLVGVEDFVQVLRYLVGLPLGRGHADDIDHLGNRRVRTMDELFADDLRKGLLRMKRNCQERLSLLDEKKAEQATPKGLLHYKPVSSAIEAFFARSELSQIVDQTNPLSQLAHERRLSALGPGGLNRKRAGFEVRDVHISHYGRICPIETPEGANIGLISSLAIYARVDEYGFLITPYRVFRKGRFSGEVTWLRADEEDGRIIAPADIPVDADGRIAEAVVLARQSGEFVHVKPEDVELMDVSPKQLVSLSAALIPFLEHDDANRALMGSNMQRQAVPLLTCEPPVVSTGMERPAAENSSLVVRAEEPGTVKRATALEVVVDDRVYPLVKFSGLTDKTCQTQRPCVRTGDRVEKNQVIADGAATSNGELALGKNVLVAFMTYDGYNFEDAILISERLVREDVFTSVHIEDFEIEVRETDLGREEITPDVPNVAKRALRNLDERGLIRVGASVKPGDILVGKVAPKSKTELSAEEKLLRAIFGRMGEEVKNESLEVPPGVEGVVIDAVRFQRKTHLTDEERERLNREVDEAKRDAEARLRAEADVLVGALERLLKGPVLLEGGAIRLHPDDLATMEAREVRQQLAPGRMVCPEREVDALVEIVERAADRIEAIEVARDRAIERHTKGDQLPAGVLELIKIYIATKRRITVGDKMAGRHGNKGVVARVLPVEDMPHLEDGTPVDMCLNPLGVPSRMNVGQILETHLGWAAKALGFQAVTPVFDGTTEDDIAAALREAGLPPSGKVQLYDGRTGEPFGQDTTVGYLYMLKLHHMVDDKIHARATGPYSLITQQPLGGKARFGGQRFGEMEVWALEAYGAANILQELLTVKSDDVDGRAKIYESMVKGKNILEPGTPVSFAVLTNEIKGLCLNLELETPLGRKVDEDEERSERPTPRPSPEALAARAEAATAAAAAAASALDEE